MSLNRKQIDKILSDYKFEKKRQKGSHQRFEKNWEWVTVATKSEFLKKTAVSMLKKIAFIVWENYKSIIKKYWIKI